MNPVLLLHGALGSKSQLDFLKNALEADSLTVYSMDFSGHHGEPFHDDFAIDAFAADVLMFLDGQHLARVDIFGYSMGGYVALWFAHVHRERVDKIVTLSTKFDWDPASAEKEIKKLNPENIAEKVPAFARILQHRHVPNNWKELLHDTAAMMLGFGNEPLLTDNILKTISQKVVILLGDRDDMADPLFSRVVADTLPNGKFLLLKDTPHPIEKVDVKLLQESPLAISL
jgi:pimeloyl-ACP methyl ester carboxylesterase